MHNSSPSRCFSDSVDDIWIARATTEIAAHPLSNFCLGKVSSSKGFRNVFRGRARPARLCFPDHGDCRHDLSGCTETTLEPVVLDECLLDWMKLSIAFQSFDRGDLLTIVHCRQCHARQNTATINVDRACAAFASVA